MTHKPAPRRDTGAPVYVSSSLTVELKPQLRAWAERNESELFEHIASALMENYSFSAKQEESGVAVTLRALENCKNTLNRGKALCERAGTYSRAACRLFWAHEELFERHWPEGIRSIEDDW